MEEETRFAFASLWPAHLETAFCLRICELVGEIYQNQEHLHFKHARKIGKLKERGIIFLWMKNCHW